MARGPPTAGIQQRQKVASTAGCQGRRFLSQQRSHGDSRAPRRAMKTRAHAQHAASSGTRSRDELGRSRPSGQRPNNATDEVGDQRGRRPWILIPGEPHERRYENQRPRRSKRNSAMPDDAGKYQEHQRQTAPAAIARTVGRENGHGTSRRAGSCTIASPQRSRSMSTSTSRNSGGTNVLMSGRGPGKEAAIPQHALKDGVRSIDRR